MRQSWETMTSVSAGHIIQTPTQPVGSRRPQRESNPGPPHQESRALPQSYRAPLKLESRKKKSNILKRNLNFKKEETAKALNKVTSEESIIKIKEAKKKYMS